MDRVRHVYMKLRDTLVSFLSLDDGERRAVFSKMTVPEVDDLIVLVEYLEEFKKSVKWDSDV